MTGARKRLGASGEDAAARFYRRHGYEILVRNWRVKEGEIDLICRRGGEVVFVEVKTRSSLRFGTGAEAVTPAKQRRLRMLAVLWLRASGVRYRRLRFDVIDVDGRGSITPYKNAF
jgi:putative endonuclease